MENLPATTTNNLELSPLAEEYPILNPASAVEIREIIEQNQGPRGLQMKEMDHIKASSGGNTFFELPGINGTESAKEVVGVSLDFEDGRIFYRVAYEKSGKGPKSPPDCISRDGFIGVGDPGGTCADCPYSQWATDPKGGRGQACKEIRRILFLRSGQILPEIVNVPPTSLKNVRDYFKRLSSRRIPFWGLVSVLRLERVENADGVAYARMVFTAGTYLNPAERTALKPFRDEMATIFRNTTIDASDYEAMPQDHGDFTPPPGDRGFAAPTDD